MPEGLKKLLYPFIALSPARRWLVMIVATLSVLAFVLLIMAANRADYRPLFANLNNEDAGEIVRKLKEQKVPYRIEADGKVVMVPADKVYDLRLSLAAEGLPQGGGIGFEIFDRKNFGMTEFVQKLNYQRALQGELARTITQISGVEQARVHLAIPEKSLFTDNDKPPTASVIIKMKSGRNMQENEVQGIIHLVASSIEGMDPNHVTILDSRGKILSKGGASDSPGKTPTAMLETERNYEKNLEEKLQSLLDKVVGSGKSVARVSATFDFKQVEKLEEKYDPMTPQTAVRSEQKSEEKGGVASLAAGVPGVQTNMGKTPLPVPGVASGPIRSDETRNYEVGRMTSRTIEPVGTLSKISVAILVDGSYETPTAAKKGSAAKTKYIPRSPEELQKIESLVKSATGFNMQRGDQVTVANIPFKETGEAGDTGSESWWHAPIFQTLLKNAVIGLGFLALLFLVIRPLMGIIRSNAASSFQPLESSEEAQKIFSSQRTQLDKQSVPQMELIERVKKEPYQTAQILKNWLDS